MVYMKKKIKIISGRKEEIDKDIFYEALKLRYRSYFNEGLINQNKEKTLVDESDDKSYHFIALDGDKVVGCISIIEGVRPLQSIFGKEKKEVMKKTSSREAVEISRFAVDEKYRIGNKKVANSFGFVSLLLLKEMANCVIKSAIDIILITIHPKNKERYEKFYGFVQYGKEKNYLRANNNPAILLYLRKSDLIRMIEMSKVE